jgi:tripartite-type tricarboxylate transporter receptor subunit TctC
LLRTLLSWVLACAGTSGLLLAALTSPVLAEDPASYFAGRTLKIIVGLPPGGSADAYARLAQRHLPRHLPGAPAIAVENVPGAGSMKAVLYLDSLPADGTALGTFSSGLLTEAITAPQRVKVDFRDYGWIGNISADVRVCYLWHSTGVRSWQDLLARKQVVFAASARGTAGDVDASMLRELFGVRVKEVQGYPGSAAKRLAVEKGEVDGDCGGWTAIPPDWLGDHKIAVVVRLSPRLLPGMDAAIPFAGDLLKNPHDHAAFDFIVAPQRIGRPFMVSGRVPEPRVAALRQAFDAMVADPAFLSDAAKLQLSVTPLDGQEVARDVAALYATPADLVARAKAIAGE